MSDQTDRLVGTGFVLPEQWDKRGDVVSVSIMTDGLEKYIIADSAKGRELIAHIDEKVRIMGSVAGEDVDGNRILEILQYEVIQKDSRKHLNL